MFKGLLLGKIQDVHTCGEDIEILDNFTCLGNVVCEDGGSK